MRVELDLYDSYNSEFTALVKSWKLREEFNDSSSLYLLAEWDSSPSGLELCQFLKKIDQIEASATETKSIFHVFKSREVHSEPQRYWYPRVLDDPCFHPELKLSDFLKKWDKDGPFQMVTLGDRQLLVQVQFNNEFHPKSVGTWISMTKDPSYKVSVVGPSTFRYYINEILKKDSSLHFFVILFFLFFIRIFMGTWRIGFCYIFTFLMTSLTLAGLMGWLGISIDVLSNNLFLLTGTLMKVCVTASALTHKLQNLVITTAQAMLVKPNA